MSALAIAPAVATLEAEMRRHRREDARLAAMILLVAPERIGEEPIGEFLMKIDFVRRERVQGWLERAAVNPWRPGGQLSSHQRHLLVGLLVGYSKGDGEA